MADPLVSREGREGGNAVQFFAAAFSGHGGGLEGVLDFDRSSGLLYGQSPRLPGREGGGKCCPICGHEMSAFCSRVN